MNGIATICDENLNGKLCPETCHCIHRYWGRHKSPGLWAKHGQRIHLHWRLQDHDHLMLHIILQYPMCILPDIKLCKRSFGPLWRYDWHLGLSLHNFILNLTQGSRVAQLLDHSGVENTANQQLRQLCRNSVHIVGAEQYCQTWVNQVMFQLATNNKIILSCTGCNDESVSKFSALKLCRWQLASKS